MGRTGFLEAYPQFNNVYVSLPIGYSWYHALQTRVEKRFSRGYNFQAGYTWSKAMTATSFLNGFDTMPYEELSSADRPHRFTLSAQWELPFGRKRSIGANWHPALNFIAGGWNLNMMVQKQVDDALGFGGNNVFIGDPSKALLPKDQRSPEQWFDTSVFMRDSNLTNRAYAVRYAPNRYSNIRSDMQSRWDFSAIKKFQMTERFVWEFRAECFNAWNHPNLRNPNTTPTSSSFGTTTAQEPPRSWQGALRLNF
jgi:hypothetical protein